MECESTLSLAGETGGGPVSCAEAEERIMARHLAGALAFTLGLALAGHPVLAKGSHGGGGGGGHSGGSHAVARGGGGGHSGGGGHYSGGGGHYSGGGGHYSGGGGRYSGAPGYSGYGSHAVPRGSYSTHGSVAERRHPSGGYDHGGYSHGGYGYRHGGYYYHGYYYPYSYWGYPYFSASLYFGWPFYYSAWPYYDTWPYDTTYYPGTVVGYGAPAYGSAEPDPGRASSDQPPADAGRLRLEVRPEDTSVYVDDQFRGTAAEARALTLMPGRHVIELVRPGFRTERREVDIVAGRNPDLLVEMQKPY